MERRFKRKPAVRRRATAKDVIGADFSKEVPEQWRKYYDRLIEMRSFLRRGKRSQLRAAADQNLRYSQHMADAGTNSYEMDLALSRVSSRQDVLFEIDAALDRIQEGTFGKCEMTGKVIERERLVEIPWTRFSAEAERELEAKGEIERARLPQAEPVNRSATSNRVGEEWERESQDDDVEPNPKSRKR